MSYLLPPEDARKIAERLEKKVKSTKTRSIINLGLVLLIISILAFMLSSSSLKPSGTIHGYDLIFRYKLMTAQIFMLLHVLTIIVLLSPVQDKFQFATIFTLINVPLLFFIYMCDAAKRIPGFQSEANISMLCFFMLMVCWMIFGLETYKASPKFAFFKLLKTFNDKIQYFFDEYAMLDYKKAVKKLKERRKGK